jgi:hypothetical protein
MPAKNPRLTTVLEKPLYVWLRESARKQGISLSLLMRDLVRDAYERDEDIFWAKEGEERLSDFNRRAAKSHDEAWGKRK